MRYKKSLGQVISIIHEDPLENEFRNDIEGRVCDNTGFEPE